MEKFHLVRRRRRRRRTKLLRFGEWFWSLYCTVYIVCIGEFWENKCREFMDAFVMRGLSHVANHVIIISTSTRILCVFFSPLFHFQIWRFVKIFLLFIFFCYCYYCCCCCCLEEFFCVCAPWMNEWIDQPKYYPQQDISCVKRFPSIELNQEDRYRWQKRGRERDRECDGAKCIT